MKSVCHSCTDLLEFRVNDSAKVSWHQYVNLTCDFFVPSCIYHYAVQKISRLSELQAEWELEFFYPFASKKFMSYAWFLADEFLPSSSSFSLSIVFPSLSPEGHERHLSRDTVGLDTFTHLHHLIYIDNIIKIVVDLNNVHLLQDTLISTKSKL